jgi:hypothetical protein
MSKSIPIKLTKAEKKLQKDIIKQNRIADATCEKLRRLRGRCKHRIKTGESCFIGEFCSICQSYLGTFSWDQLKTNFVPGKDDFVAHNSGTHGFS